MAEFVQIMKDLRRMCNAHTNNCDKCPLASYECGRTPKNRRYFTDKQVEGIVMTWAAENPEPVYPSWVDFLITQGLVERRKYGGGPELVFHFKQAEQPIPDDIAEKLGIEPK